MRTVLGFHYLLFKKFLKITKKDHTCLDITLQNLLDFNNLYTALSSYLLLIWFHIISYLRDEPGIDGLVRISLFIPSLVVLGGVFCDVKPLYYIDWFPIISYLRDEPCIHGLVWVSFVRPSVPRRGFSLEHLPSTCPQQKCP